MYVIMCVCERERDWDCVLVYLRNALNSGSGQAGAGALRPGLPGAAESRVRGRPQEAGSHLQCNQDTSRLAHVAWGFLNCCSKCLSRCIFKVWEWEEGLAAGCCFVIGWLEGSVLLQYFFNKLVMLCDLLDHFGGCFGQFRPHRLRHGLDSSLKSLISKAWALLWTWSAQDTPELLLWLKVLLWPERCSEVIGTKCLWWTPGSSTEGVSGQVGWKPLPCSPLLPMRSYFKK